MAVRAYHEDLGNEDLATKQNFKVQKRKKIPHSHPVQATKKCFGTKGTPCTCGVSKLHTCSPPSTSEIKF